MTEETVETPKKTFPQMLIAGFKNLFVFLIPVIIGLLKTIAVYCFAGIKHLKNNDFATNKNLFIMMLKDMRDTVRDKVVSIKDDVIKKFFT